MLGCFPTGGRRPKSPPSGAYEDGSTSTSVSTASPPLSASTSSYEVETIYPDDDETEADVGGLSTAIASRRLFLAPPGRSNSIIDSSEHASVSIRVRADDGNEEEALRTVTVSTDAPRAEFLKSMVEVAAAMRLDSRDGARLHDLLLWYVAINDSDALRDILGAFTELLCLLNGSNDTAITPPATSTTAVAAGRTATHR
ncbi:unnamed protein product [Alopecurus aequalis]